MKLCCTRDQLKSTQASGSLIWSTLLVGADVLDVANQTGDCMGIHWKSSHEFNFFNHH